MNPSCYFNFKRYINKAYFNFKRYIIETYIDKIPNKEWWERPFQCKYEILDNGIIEAKIDYPYFCYELEPTDFDTKGKPIPHIAVCGISPYKKRDFLIFDNNKCFLLKNAQVDADMVSMVCRAKEYFISYNVDKNRMFKFFEEIKVKSIKIFAKTLNEFKNTDIFFKEENPKTFDKLKDKTYLKTLELYKHREIFVKHNNNCVEISYISKEYVNINKNNISKISMQIGNSPDSSNKSSVYIQIDLIEAVDPDKVYDYLEEIAIYFQLFYPSKIKIDQVSTILEDVDQEVDTIIEEDNCLEFVTYQLSCFQSRFFDKQQNYDPSKKEYILDFLKRCHDKISYRTCDNYIRDIKHFLFNLDDIFMPDRFLRYFIFIEAFYKDKTVLSKAYEIFEKAFEEHYDEELSDTTKKDYIIDDMRCLRNHFSHVGYHFPSAGIKYKKKRKKFDDTILYNRSRIIHSIAMNIIFKSILGYESHEFPNPYSDSFYEYD